MSSQISKSNPKALVLFYIIRSEMFIRKHNNWNVVITVRVGGVVRMFSDRGLTSQDRSDLLFSQSSRDNLLTFNTLLSACTL